MTLKQSIKILLSALVLSSCADKSSDSEKTSDSNKYFGIQIINKAPTGATYIDKTGKTYQYRSIMVDITNDTIVPVGLQIAFLNKYIDLTPTTENKYKVFLLPDSMTRNKQFNSNDSISKNLETYLNKELYESAALKQVIQPKETYKLRLGFLFDISGGLTRAEIFSKGHHNNLSLPKKDSIKDIKINNSNKKGIDLILGVALNPKTSFASYSSIICGQLFYTN